MLYTLSVIIPTFNERDNLIPLVQNIANVLKNVSWEVIIVDDNSTDGTLEVAHQLVHSHSNIRLIHRVYERGLASACVAGMHATNARYLAVMDADLQHDPDLLSIMLSSLQQASADLVIGSRYIQGGSTGRFKYTRLALSRFATRLSSWLLDVPLITDPMSGFFMMRTSLAKRYLPHLYCRGFKILLDLIVVMHKIDGHTNILELPYTFRPRHTGQSKLTFKVGLEYLGFLFHASRFIKFCFVGGSGIFVQFFFLMLLLYAHLAFLPAQCISVFIAMISNYIFNNVFTYQSRRRRGKAHIMGFFSYAVICGIGGFLNVISSTFFFTHEYTSWPLAAIMGNAVACIWNYALTRSLIWRHKAE